MFNCDYVWRTVNDLYKYAKEEETPLLTDFSSSDSTNDFWEFYVENYELLDKLFAVQFKNYRYFDQDISGDNDIEDVFNDFQASVLAWLTTHDKAYTQLYSIELATNIPAPTSDYDITETKTATRTNSNSYISGQRSDSTQDTSGQRTDVTTGQVMGYNSSTFVDNTKDTSQVGSQQNSSSLTKGQQTDTESKSETEGYTIRTSGTKGNPNENLKSYVETWNSYSFYETIFLDICKAFLLS